jgi:hypothetical protein
MSLSIVLATVLLLICAWAITNPTDARTIIAHLKRCWRLLLIRRYGERNSKEFFHRFSRIAEQEGFDKDLVHELIEKHRDEVANRLGKKEAIQRLGDPTPLERWH